MENKAEDPRIKFITYISLLGVVTFVLFSTLHMIRGNYPVGVVEMFLALGVIANYFYAKNPKNLDTSSNAILLLVFIGLVLMLTTGGLFKTGIIWFAVFPILTVFLKGKKIGFRLNSSLNIILLTLALLNYLGVVHLVFDYKILLVLVFNLGIISRIAYIFDNYADFLRDALASKAANLETLVQKKDDIQKELEEALEKAKLKNQEIDETKIAIFNLLDDSHQLEEALKKEKAGVELKVQERTEDLQKERGRLESIISSTPLGLVVVNNNLDIQLINQKAKEMFGETLSVGTNVKDLDQKTNLKIGEMLNKNIQNSETANFDSIQYFGKFLDFHISPIIIDGRDRIGFIVLVEDVTEKRTVERAKDEFFSIASHELRTPLTAIRGNTALINDMYKDKVKDPEFGEMITDIHDASIRLIGIVNDFLNIGRLEMGKIEFKKVNFDPGKIVTEIIDELKVQTENKNVELKFINDDKNIPSVFADPDRTREVLINLVGNALKFTEKGSVTVEMSVDTGFVRFCVKDTGRGLSLENQQLLFRKFQQAGSSLYTRDTTKGTGLGLYISRLMVTGMNGKIWLEKSEEGKGSEFCFTLPIAN